MEHFRSRPLSVEEEDVCGCLSCLLFDVRNKYMQVSYANLFVAVNPAVQKEKASCVRIEQDNVFIIIIIIISDIYKLIYH